MVKQEQESDLICPSWEEAIIKEGRMPDMPFDLMQENTIVKTHNNNIKKPQDLDASMKPSN
jgi:hypothetical protein